MRRAGGGTNEDGESGGEGMGGGRGIREVSNEAVKAGGLEGT